MIPKSASEYNITGMYGCNCHPFRTWAEEIFHRQQIFLKGDKVINRCKDQGAGTVTERTDRQGFCIVQFEGKPRRKRLYASDSILMHSTNLTRL